MSYMKFDNLQYNTLGRWVKRLIDQVSDVPSIIFFIISHRLRAIKNLYLYFCKVIKKMKKKLKWFLQRILQEIRNQTLGRWVICPIDPATQHIILKIVGFIVSTKHSQFQHCSTVLKMGSGIWLKVMHLSKSGKKLARNL
jgi:hypothetical protein